LAGAAPSADSAGLATTAGAVGGTGAAVAGAVGDPFADALGVALGDTLVPALTLTKAEGPVSAPRACVEPASCGANGSNAPRSPLPLTSVVRGAVRPATAHGTAEPLAGRALALASRRDAGDASDEGAALGRAAATVAALLRASRDGVGNGVGLRALPPGAGRDGTGSTVRPIVCTPPRSFVFLVVVAVAVAAAAGAAAVDAEGGDRLGAGPAIVVSDGVGNFASTLSAAAVSAGAAAGVAIATVVSA